MRTILIYLTAALLIIGSSCSKPEKSPGQAKPCDAPMAAITFDYPGAGVKQVEQSVVLPVEVAIRALGGVARVRSIAHEARAEILVEFDRRADLDATFDTLREALRQLTSLPQETEWPLIRLLEPGVETTLIVVYGDQTLAVLADTAHDLRDQLLSQAPVARVQLVGLPDREIEVQVDQAMLPVFNITLDQVAAALRAQSVDLPAGAVKTNTGEIVLGAASARSEVDLGNVVIHQSALGMPVYLRDFATIREDVAESGRRAFYSGSPAVLMEVTPRPEQKRAFAEALQLLVTNESVLPQGVRTRLLGSILRCEGEDKLTDADRAIRARLRLPPGSSRQLLFDTYQRALGKISGQGRQGVLGLLGSPPGTDQRETIVLLAFAGDESAATTEAQHWQSTLGNLPGIEALVESADRKEIAIDLAHPDLEILEKAATELAATLAKREDVLQIDHAENNRDELKVSLSAQGRELGIQAPDVARVIRNAVHGVEVFRWQRGREEIRVMLRLGNRSDHDDIEQLGNLLIDVQGKPVPLNQFITIERQRVPSSIRRLDGRRMTSVVVAVDAATVSPAKFARQLRDTEIQALTDKYPDLASEIAVPKETLGAWLRDL